MITPSPLLAPLRAIALPLSLALFALPTAESAPQPETVIDFSGGTTDWNPNQTSGKFRRTDSGNTNQVRIETDGSEAYLRTGGAPVLFYDVTPSTPDFTLFSVAEGDSLRLSVDFFYFSESSVGGMRIGVYSPGATGVHKGVGTSVTFNDDTSAYNLGWSGFANTTGTLGTLNLTNFSGYGAIDGGLSFATPYRLEFIYTHQGSVGAFVSNLYSLSGVEPALIQSSQGTLAYGTGTSGADLDPDALALAFRFNNLNNNGLALNAVRFEVIPEPSIAGFAGVTALGLAVLKAKRKSKR